MEAAGTSYDRVTSEVQEAVMQTRMQPVGGLFSRFHRVVRDLARSLGKEIELSVSGELVELDKSLIEALTDPLTHIIRNAADHGIEDPDTRKANGKSAGSFPSRRTMLKLYAKLAYVVPTVMTLVSRFWNTTFRSPMP